MARRIFMDCFSSQRTSIRRRNIPSLITFIRDRRAGAWEAGLSSRHAETRKRLRVSACWSFLSARGDTQALAELGFVVVEIEGMGNPKRSKKFHDTYFGNMGDDTLPDQLTGMKQLAQRYPWI